MPAAADQGFGGEECISRVALPRPARILTTAVAFRTASSEIRNPDGSVVFQAEGIEVPAEWSQVAADILAQKYFRKAGVPTALMPVPEAGVPAWLWRRRADESALAAMQRNRPPRRRDQCPPGLRPHGRDLDLLGLEGRLFRRRGGRRRLLRRDPADARAPDGRPELAAMVQHRAPLGLWHRRAGAGPLVRRLPHRRTGGLDQRL